MFPKETKKNFSFLFSLLLILIIPIAVILLHFIIFQIKYPLKIGVITTDIVIVAIALIMLFETQHLSRTWGFPFTWINVGVFLFFLGVLLEILGEFFVRFSFIKYSIENSCKILSFGILIWGFFQWAKEKINVQMKVKKLSNLDSLTQLYNRQYFDKEFKRQEEIASRYPEPFSLFYLNIDNFKRYNEKNGTVLGDKLLCILAKLLTQNMRREDYLFRYGGDEFMILLPLQGKEQAIILAQRIRRLIKEKFRGEGITVSVVVAQYEKERPIIKEMEEEMRKIKISGKDKIEILNYSPPF